MCGIAGLYSPSFGLRAMGDPAGIVRNMTQSFVHRGPDADGLWVDQQHRCVLGHRRLSIIDISDAGRQPMTDAAGRWVISFNGEIYNFQDIRSELQAKSVTLKGRTDTEVLLESIALWGVEALLKLDGMYAFAAFDTLTGEMLLARDPFGEKPLYYMELSGGGLAFASELQALEKVPGFNSTISADALAEVLMFQYIGAPRSIYQGVQKLPPGHWMRLAPGRPPEIRRFFAFEPGAKGYTNQPMAQLADELEDILVRSLQRRLVADVPLGAFLSGGVDSSTVCALARRKLGVSLKTFSIGFSGDAESEHEIARKFAALLGTQHHDKIISPSAVDFLNHAGKLLDEPNADSSCLPTYYLSEFARQHVTVALSGDGGDELFGGYGRYFQTLKEAEDHENQRMPTWSPGRNYYYSNRILVFSPEQLAQLFGFIPVGAAENVRRLMGEVDNERIPLLHRMRASDVENYMPGAVLSKVDRMSMRHSLEVRTPFLNMELARFAERLPAHYLVGGGRGKLLLKEIAYRYLPREMIDLPKKGFGLPLTAGWGKSNLVSALRESLGEDSPLGNWLGADRAKKFVDLQASEYGFSIYQAWSVIMLDKWLRNRPVTLPDVEKLLVIPQKDVIRHYSKNIGNRVRKLCFIVPSVLVVSSAKVDEPDEETSIAKQLSNADYILLCAFERSKFLDLERKKSTVLSRTYSFDADWSITRCLQEAQIDVAQCTILSLERDYQWISCSDIQNLRSQRLLRLIIPERYQTNGTLIDYKFNHFSPIGRIINILRLLRFAKRFWRTKNYRADLWGGYQIKFERFNPEKDRESSLNYALFNGPVQFLPFVSSHREIADTEERRYSIWNQDIYYSISSQPRPWYLRPLFALEWVAPINKDTSHLLPVATKRIEIGEFGCVGSLTDALIHLAEKTNLSLINSNEPDFIVLYTHALSAGGAERQWCILAIGLREIGKRVCLVVDSYVGANGHYLNMVRSAGVEVVQAGDEKEYLCSSLNDEKLIQLFNPLIFPAAVSMSKLATVLDRLKPDVLVAQLDYPNITGAAAALLVDVPKIVISFRSYNPSHFDFNQPWFLPAYKALMRSDRIVVTGNSRLGNSDYEKWIGIDEGNVHLLKNAYQPDSYKLLSQKEKKDFRDSLGIRCEQKIVFGAFRLSREKNPQLFVDTCTQVLKRNPLALALLCGEGVMHGELEKSIRQSGLSDRFRLLGRRSDIWKFLSIADVLLLTSDKEGTPNIVREGLMLNCPVVSTACGAVPEMIKDGVNGHIVPLGDMQTLALCVERVLFNVGHRAELIHRIAADQDIFTPKDMANLLLDILNQEAKIA